MKATEKTEDEEDENYKGKMKIRNTKSTKEDEDEEDDSYKGR